MLCMRPNLRQRPTPRKLLRQCIVILQLLAMVLMRLKLGFGLVDVWSDCSISSIIDTENTRETNLERLPSGATASMVSGDSESVR